MGVLGQVHTAFSLIGVFAGGIVFLMTKGTRWHRTFGHIYFTAMTGMIVTSFSIYDLTGSFNGLHWAALLSAITLGSGLLHVLTRRPKNNWMVWHSNWMSWSYVGLIAALFAEIVTRIVVPLAAPILDQSQLWSLFWGLVLLMALVVSVAGLYLIKIQLPRTLKRLQTRG
ncbi:MAG: DUF2306 domain-containing protein [Longimicrobiales bacterium]|nr:DUF2306 domain-containing protein [Longimicrobiales bacterium]